MEAKPHFPFYLLGFYLDSFVKWRGLRVLVLGHAYPDVDLRAAGGWRVGGSRGSRPRREPETTAFSQFPLEEATAVDGEPGVSSPGTLETIISTSAWFLEHFYGFIWMFPMCQEHCTNHAQHTSCTRVTLHYGRIQAV